MFRAKRPISFFNVLSISYLVIALISPFMQSEQMGIFYFEFYIAFSIMILFNVSKVIRNHLNGKKNKVAYMTATNVWSLWIWLCTSISNQIILFANLGDYSSITELAKQANTPIIGHFEYYHIYLSEIWFSYISLTYIILSLIYFVFAVFTKRLIVATNSVCVTITLANLNILTIELDEVDQINLISETKAKDEEIYLPQIQPEIVLEQSMIANNQTKDLLLIHKLEFEPPHFNF